ncbi:MAG: flagellar hook-associated protein FlgL [Gammaproteobacteria bacterium]|jgi:flagellar hook-associated protein 3 FlgL|nr:flagellar hook-associated protein FlgL [Gammaproteobacteria bacterium]MBP6052754.1 flagellar hook-associated protein FlgL [Pseudomonadales bacterium]MBK6584093.1 flagellar hook-associated protein FlgL [Gammaproteobacteria bacterium]MBK7520283.1 flagellar hook-associated protein FlgL [Gammaproteobacteria bacterium]MBK7729497.1 flagellar hook-associated protein FlgL [Gammaproteobacteria bacterium]
MRISSLQVYNAGVRQMNDAQAAVQRSQAEISSGKRVITPADDPSAAALALQIEQSLALNEQYLRNADFAERDLRQEETQLEAVENVLFRLRELAVLAGNGALSVAERGAIVIEAEQKHEQLLGIFNTRTASGDYMFAGASGGTMPFVERDNGAVTYAGDQGQRKLAVAPGVEVAVSDSGQKLFVDVPAANQNFTAHRTGANSGAGDISTGRVVDQAAFDALYPDDLLLIFDNPPTTYSVVRRNHANGTQTVFATAQPFVTGQIITLAGTETRISGSPAAGDRFRINSSPTQSLLETVQRFVDGLKASPDTTAGAAERARVVAETLDNLDLAEQSVFGSRAELGTRLDLVDDLRAEQQDVALIQQGLLSDTVDVDFNEAASRLAFQNFVLQAAQQSFAKFANLSLFNFLR